MHVPFDDALPGTDTFIPFDEVKGSVQLPRDHAVQIVLHCRSSHMSAIARATLNKLSDAKIRELQGGFDP